MTESERSDKRDDAVEQKEARLGRTDLFATPLWHIDLSQLGIVEPARVALNAERAADPTGVKISNRGGWQSRSNLHQQAPFAPVVEALAQSVLAPITAELQIRPSVSSSISALWGNINDPGEYNDLHHHCPGPLLSGVLYLAVPTQAGAVRFHDPRPQSAISSGYDQLVGRSTILTSMIGEVTPRPGLCLVFNSWLYHDVQPSAGTGERISMAFNMSIDRSLGSSVN